MRAIIGIILTLWAADLFGQSVWEYEGGPCGGTFPVVISHSGGVVAAPAYKTFLLFGNAEGTLWRQSDLPGSASVSFSLYSAAGRLLAGSFGRVYRSDDDGASWQVADIPDLLSAHITRLTGSGDTVYGCADGTLIRSVDRGERWELLPEFRCNDVLMSKSGRVTVAEDTRIAESSDGGASWFERNGNPEAIEYLYYSGEALFASRPASYLRPQAPVLFRLSDSPAGSWEPTALREPFIITMTESDGILYAGCNAIQEPHLLRSLDGGVEWEAINETRPPFPRPRAVAALLGVKGGLLACISNLGIWRLADNAESWSYVSDGYFPVGVARVGFLGERVVAYSMKENFVATRAGRQGPWTLVPYSEMMVPGDMLVHSGAIYLGNDSGIRRTTDLGTSWEFGPIGDGSRRVLALGVAGERIVAGAVGGVSAWSEDFGMTWTSDTTDRIDTWYTFAGHNSGDVFAATSRLGLFRSSGPGAEWGTVNVPGMSAAIFDAVVKGDTLIAASKTGIVGFLLDGQLLPLVYDKAVYRLCATPYGLVAATQDDGIIFFPDFGAEWQTINQGLPEAHFASPDVCRIAFSYRAGRLYFGNCGMPGLWSIDLTSATSAEATASPEGIQIDGVYPQPITGTGRIVLRGAQDEDVRIVLRDILGRQLRILYQGRLSFSPTTVALDARGLGKGTYIIEVSSSHARSFRAICVTAQ